MHRLIAVAVCVGLSIPILAEDKADEWPQKGDVVFVSAELVYSHIDPSFDTGRDAARETPIPACIPMDVRKIKTKKPTWIVGPTVGAGSVRLDGDWRSRFHRSEDECDASLAKFGQPKFTRLGWIHVIQETTPSVLKKGDVVYVSAELVYYYQPEAPPLQTPGYRETDVPACVPMTIRKAKPGKDRWDIKNPVGGYHRMEGPWLPEFHRTAAECRARYTERGNPVIVREAHIHRIIPS